jgi:hypothetical protein
MTSYAVIAYEVYFCSYKMLSINLILIGNVNITLQRTLVRIE